MIDDNPMTPLRDIADIPLAVDLRIGLEQAQALRAPAARYALWRDAPFGASADIAVWPSVFVPPRHARRDRIVMEPGQAPFWDAFQAWNDLRSMAHHLRPLPLPTVLVALALHRDDTHLADPDYALGQLLATGLSPETRKSEAMFMGYDLTDQVLSSALFDGARGADFVPPECARTDYGLIADAESASQLRRALEQDDPAHAPLLRVSVWSLGQRAASPEETDRDQ